MVTDAQARSHRRERLLVMAARDEVGVIKQFRLSLEQTVMITRKRSSPGFVLRGRRTYDWGGEAGSSGRSVVGVP